MMILKGAPVSEKIKTQINDELVLWRKNKIAFPHLTVVLVGADPASEIYVNRKKKMCETLGFTSEVVRFDKTVQEIELIQKIKLLNENKVVDGILVQLPLPNHLDSRKVLESISADKDVDCLTEKNLGRMLTDQALILPCTPSGIIEIFKHYHIDIKSKNIAVIGRSLIVGTPLMHMLIKANATVTLFHSQSIDIAQQMKNFEIVCVAVGKKSLLKTSDFKSGAIVIDIGMNRTDDGLTGDVENTENDQQHLKAITPVPGGVGLMTIAMLMKNTLILAKQHRSISTNRS